MTTHQDPQVTAPAGAAVDIVGVTQALPVKHGEALRVLDDVNLSATPGSFTALIGPSGCGKSTLLRLLAGLDAALFGKVYADGSPITDPDPSRALVFQDPTLLPWLTVRQNIELGPRVRGDNATATMPPRPPSRRSTTYWPPSA